MKNVLLVSQETTSDLEAILRSFSVNAHVVGSGCDALQYLRENKPDLILSDVHLNDISGGSLCYRVKRTKRLKHVAVFLLADSSDHKQRADATMSSADEIILKPYSASLLREKLRAYLFTQDAQRLLKAA